MPCQQVVIRNNHIWVSSNELLGLVPPRYKDKLAQTMKIGTYRQRATGLNSWEHVKENGTIFINYQSIPAPTLTKYDLPDPAALVSQQLEALVQVPHNVRDFYLRHDQVFEIGDELAEQAAWLLFLAGTTAKAARELGYQSIDTLYEDAMAIMNSKPWSKWKCNSLQVLKRKLKPFNQHLKKGSDIKTALKSLISGKYGNSNSQKMTEDQEVLIIQLAANDEGVKLNWRQVWWHYTQEATKMVAAYQASNGAHGWPEKSLISESTVKQFIHRPDIAQVIYKRRHGRAAYRNEFTPVTKRKGPSMANAVWVIDGTPLHRYFYDYENKTAYARLNVFTVIDAHSWCPIGFYVSLTETTEAVIGALRAACKVTGSLPHQIIFDNSSAIKSYKAQACMKQLTHRLTAAEVGNARAKMVENFFKMFNEQVLKYRAGYTGSPFMAKSKTNQPNPEQISKWIKDKQLPSVDQAVRDCIEDYTIFQNRIMEEYKAAPIDRYRKSMLETKDQQRTFTHEVDVAAFYEMPGIMKKVKVMEEGKQRTLQQFVPREYQYTAKGLTMQLDKVEHDFMLDNPAFNANHIGDSFNIKYDPKDISKAYLYKDGKPFRFEGAHLALPVKDQFHMALIDRVEGEAQRLANHLANKKKQEELVDARYSANIETAKLAGVYRPVITANAFDKNALHAAQQERLEQAANGDRYSIMEAVEDHTKSTPANLSSPGGGAAGGGGKEEINNDVELNPIDRWAI